MFVLFFLSSFMCNRNQTDYFIIYDTTSDFCEKTIKEKQSLQEKCNKNKNL